MFDQFVLSIVFDSFADLFTSNIAVIAGTEECWTTGQGTTPCRAGSDCSTRAPPGRHPLDKGHAVGERGDLPGAIFGVPVMVCV